MQKILLIRHAKSSWKDPHLPDNQRPLNERGLRDALKMAEFISEKIPTVDALLVSNAKRTRQTASFFIKNWKLSKDQVFYLKDLYLASVVGIEQIIRSIDENIESLALIGHNPGITNAVNLIPAVHIDNVPTCGVYVGSEKEVWSNFRFRNVLYETFVYPKLLFPT